MKIPKKYQKRILSIDYDSDGYWCILNDGWCWDFNGLHTIHEDTKTEVLKCIRNTEPCSCDMCKERKCVNKHGVKEF